MVSIMKIAHFVSNFPKSEKSEVYGKSLAAYNICLSLARKRHDVYVFTISENKKDCVEDYKGIKVYRYGSLFGYHSERFSFKILYKPLDFDFDVVHIHSGISMTVVGGFRYVMKKRKPLVITWHGDSVREPKYCRYTGLIPNIAAYFYKYLADKILSYADVIISVSKSFINESKFLHKYIDKIVFIPNGIDLEEFNIPYSKEECRDMLKLDREKNIILFVGSLHPLKGPHILLKAIPKIIKENRDTLFVFVGGGDIDRYKELSEELGIRKYVKFTGYVNENKPFYYKASDIFVLSSFLECLPLVILEAMACGVPVVASDIGGIPDIVENGKNGLLIPSGNSDALADAIIYLLENEDIIKKMGWNGREKAGEYSWSRIAEETEKVYLSLMR